jgi:hypothetical protein
MNEPMQSVAAMEERQLQVEIKSAISTVSQKVNEVLHIFIYIYYIVQGLIFTSDLFQIR